MDFVDERLQVDLRDMDKMVQGISKLCRLNIKLELKRAKVFYHKHIVKSIFVRQMNITSFYIVKSR